MNRKLSYNGKTLSQMTKQELEAQYETNKKRLVARSGFLGGVGVLACFVMPVLAVGPLAAGAVTGNWLIENNKAIKEELEKR